MEDTQPKESTATEAPACNLQKDAVQCDNAQASNASATDAPTANVPSAPEEELIDIQYFAKVKFRVGIVTAAEMVPKSKKLLKLQVDLGPHGTRQILSGIAQYYSPESMIGKKIIVVANLKPATLMGLESQGMLLAASTEDGSTLTLMQPEGDIPVGAQVR
jgi:methionyl-tRNA synthetase